MAAIGRADLNYKDYSWTAVTGDDPTKTKEDADRFSRYEGYEVLTLLNSLTAANGVNLSLKSLLIAEWMIHEELPPTIQGREKVKKWIHENFSTLKLQYPF